MFLKQIYISSLFYILLKYLPKSVITQNLQCDTLGTIFLENATHDLAWFLSILEAEYDSLALQIDNKILESGFMFVHAEFFNVSPSEGICFLGTTRWADTIDVVFIHGSLCRNVLQLFYLRIYCSLLGCWCSIHRYRFI